MHKVYNPEHDCDDPSEEDNKQNWVDQCINYVSCKRCLYGFNIFRWNFLMHALLASSKTFWHSLSKTTALKI